MEPVWKGGFQKVEPKLFTPNRNDDNFSMVAAWSESASWLFMTLHSKCPKWVRPASSFFGSNGDHNKFKEIQCHSGQSNYLMISSVLSSMEIFRISREIGIDRNSCRWIFPSPNMFRLWKGTLEITSELPLNPMPSIVHFKKGRQPKVFGWKVLSSSLSVYAQYAEKTQGK